MTTLNINFSTISNLNCINNDIEKNKKIIDAIKDGSFAQHVVNTLTPGTTTLFLRGSEPGLNGKYFSQLIQPILQDTDSIKYISLITNGTIPLFNHFIVPLYNITRQLGKRIIFTIYININGPDIIQDHVNVGSHKIITANLEDLRNKICVLKENPYLRIKLLNRSILTAFDFYTDPKAWVAYMSKLHTSYSVYNNYNFKTQFNNKPMFEAPGNYSQQDGIEFCKWKNLISYQLDCTQACATGAGANILEYSGELYDCHLCKNKPEIDIKERKKHFNTLMRRLQRQHEISSTVDAEDLWALLNRVCCWGLCGEEIPESMIKLFGNGMV